MTLLMLGFSAMSVVKADDFEYPVTYGYYVWEGNPPSFIFDITNGTSTNQPEYYLNWQWWDNWSAGYGYVHEVKVVYDNTNQTILDNTPSITVYWQGSPYVMPFAFIGNLSHYCILDFDSLNAPKFHFLHLHLH